MEAGGGEWDAAGCVAGTESRTVPDQRAGKSAAVGAGFGRAGRL